MKKHIIPILIFTVFILLPYFIGKLFDYGMVVNYLIGFAILLVLCIVLFLAYELYRITYKNINN